MKGKQKPEEGKETEQETAVEKSETYSADEKKPEAETEEKPEAASDEQQSEENDEGAETSSETEEKSKETGTSAEAETETELQKSSEQADGNAQSKANPDTPFAQSRDMELIEARAQLAAFKSGIAANAVEDAVCLAIHDAQKNGTVDENSVAEALKSVLERHPEWKNKENTASVRVGADSTQEASSGNDEISKIFGNK